MPGHKRLKDGCYEIDMTEVDGVDDLHDPQDVIKEEQQRLAKVYGAKESFMLVGGSTVGNLSAIYGVCNENDLILIQRNSHKSVYNGTILRHLKVGYINSELDENGIYRAVKLSDICKAIDIYGKPKAIEITSPTYEGFICNIDEISNYCKEKDIVLIVDEAHGAHLGINKYFPGTSVGRSDITIQSLHKTLPCLTMTAALHISGDRIDSRKIKAAVDIFESSSPSYVLMNSISECLDFIDKSEKPFEDYVDNLTDFYKFSGQLKHLNVLNFSKDIKDLGKIVISTKKTDITGVKLAALLRDNYELETELSSFSYVLAMTSVMDTKEGFNRLKKALKEIDDSIDDGNVKVPLLNVDSQKIMEPWEAKSCDEKMVPLKEAKGNCSGDMICLYPPGAPIIVPGEIITGEAIDVIEKALNNGIHVTGLNNGFIVVVN